MGGSTALAPLKPVILSLIEKEREYVQTDARKKKSQFSLKNIASIGQNITARSTPNTVSTAPSQTSCSCCFEYRSWIDGI